MKLKVCGIKSTDEALILKDLNIDYYGLIFAKSKRQVSLETAQKIVQVLKPKKIVAVITKQENIAKILEVIKPNVVQLHDEFELKFCMSLQEKGFEVWRVFSVLDTLPNTDDFVQKNIKILFDTKGANKGGNNLSFNWEILNNFKHPFILAGGLKRDNILKAKSYKPSILDLNSGVETNGYKDKTKVQEIINLIKEDK